MPISHGLDYCSKLSLNILDFHIKFAVNLLVSVIKPSVIMTEILNLYID